MSDEREREKQEDGPTSDNRQAKKSDSGVIAVSTSDPAIELGQAMEGPPEQAVRYQTTHVSAPRDPYPFETGGDVVQERREQQKGREGQEDRKQGSNHGKKRQVNGQQGGQERGKQDDRQQAEEQEGRDEEDESARRRKKGKQPEHGTSALNWKTLFFSAVLALICGVGGAWGYSAVFAPSKSDKQDQGKKDSDKDGKSGSDKGSGKSGSSEGGASASEIPGFSSAKDADTFRKELEHLSHRLDLLTGRIDQITQPETQTPPVLHTLQEKVNELEREVDRVANLPHRFEQLQQKLLSTQQEFKMLKERVSGEEMPLGNDVSPTVPELDHHIERHAAPLGSEPIGSDNPADEATLKLAIALFREAHYTQSYDVLRRLQRESPQDARVWYYSALARGMATRDWSGKTKQLAEQGLVSEKAGKPSRAVIDAALATVPSDLGKDWLAEQRQQVRTP